MNEAAAVFVVDDDPALRDSLVLLIQSVDLPVRAYASADVFLESYDDEPGCLITDLRMPGMSGLELQEALLERGAAIPVIILTAYGDVPAAVRAMKRGAVDFLEKPFNAQQLLDMVNRALAGDAQRREQAAEVESIAERVAKLTPREREVMQLVVTGKANKVVAAELGISERTVELHRSRLMKKTGARSVADLVRLASTLD